LVFSVVTPRGLTGKTPTFRGSILVPSSGLEMETVFFRNVGVSAYKSMRHYNAEANIDVSITVRT
jgi:hypothetical protein